MMQVKGTLKEDSEGPMGKIYFVGMEERKDAGEEWTRQHK